jgi:hypothetical protein
VFEVQGNCFDDGRGKVVTNPAACESSRQP